MKLIFDGQGGGEGLTSPKTTTNQTNKKTDRHRHITEGQTDNLTIKQKDRQKQIYIYRIYINAGDFTTLIRIVLPHVKRNLLE